MKQLALECDIYIIQNIFKNDLITGDDDFQQLIHISLVKSSQSLDISIIQNIL